MEKKSRKPSVEELRAMLADLTDAVWRQAANRGSDSLSELLRSRAERADRMLRGGQ